ncbi:carbohydrate-binding module family 20 domain-containing protein [Roseateles amylovorans]|uniref:Alpha-amylase n=1 Tax=Roseateles amylovorans TaxID=2978473 RepID=A0ABY6B0Y8_9BURK|nr:alpha-amylase family glycosyl hydrolase [Roseateles amylovorans]UXH78510.1 alpha-amylase family glycosyl hydrolase [Roseateles amylovorans]
MRPGHTPRRRLQAASWLLGLGLGLGLGGSAWALNPNDTSVQMFQWKWNDLAYECTQSLGPNGYGAIQISPPSASKVTNAWWGVYQPVNYVSFKSTFGTEAELRNMISTCHAAGVRVYADVVVNQLAGDSSATAGLASDGSSWSAANLSYPYFSANDFHSNCTIQPADYETASGRANVQNCRLSGMPDLRTESSYVQGQIVNYLRTLVDMGIDGFRIDAAKHQPASALNAILSTLKASRPTTQMGEPIWVTQEIIPDAEVARNDYLVNGTLNEYRYVYLMKEAFRNLNGATPASIPTAMGTWNNWGGTWGFLQPSQATVFVNNWDSEREGTSLNASNFTGTTNDTQGSHRYDLANLFMLAQGYGEAQLHSGYRFTNKDQGKPSASPYVNGVAQVNVNWDFIHRWPHLAAMVKFRSAARGQALQNWVTGTANQIAFSRGKVGFVALNNTTKAWTRSFATGLPAGTYCNVVHGVANAAGTACAADTVTVDAAGNATITIPADGGSTVPAVAIYTGQRVASTCALTFSVANAGTTMGQGVYVVGNQTALGSWTPSRGFPLTIQGSGASATWSGTVVLPANTATQYKYVKWNGSSAVWEANQSTGSGNREITSCAAGGSASRNDGSFAK